MCYEKLPVSALRPIKFIISKKKINLLFSFKELQDTSAMDGRDRAL
jgi:hypothetical protein